MIADLNIAELPSLPFSERKSLPTSRAIYVVSSPTGEVLYVGATRSLRDRWRMHHRRHQFESMGDVRISWVAVLQRGLMPKMEAALIEQLQPSLNRNAVPLTADQLVLVSANVLPATKQALQKLADKEGRTISNTIKRLLQQALKEKEIEKVKAEITSLGQ